MRIELMQVYGQLYLIPYCKITHTRKLNGNLELIIGWFNYEICIGI